MLYHANISLPAQGCKALFRVYSTTVGHPAPILPHTRRNSPCWSTPPRCGHRLFPKLDPPRPAQRDTCVRSSPNPRSRSNTHTALACYTPRVRSIDCSTGQRRLKIRSSRGARQKPTPPASACLSDLIPNRCSCSGDLQCTLATAWTSRLRIHPGGSRGISEKRRFRDGRDCQPFFRRIDRRCFPCAPLYAICWRCMKTMHDEESERGACSSLDIYRRQ